MNGGTDSISVPAIMRCQCRKRAAGISDMMKTPLAISEICGAILNEYFTSTGRLAIDSEANIVAVFRYLSG